MLTESEKKAAKSSTFFGKDGEAQWGWKGKGL